jgi:hypothetical protein
MTTDLSYTLAGWREWVSLPGIGVPWIKAKMDTGARTSALHAFDIEQFDKAGTAWVRYSVHPWQKTESGAVEVESKVHDMRTVRSSSGYATERYVVLMDIRLVERTFTAEVTLSRRDEMGFRMLVGRQALRQGFVVDPASSYLGGRPPRHARRANRGR